jgi:hypothetical protein
MLRNVVILIILALWALPLQAEESETKCPFDMANTAVEYQFARTGLGYASFAPTRINGRRAGFKVHVVTASLGGPIGVRVLRMREKDMRVEKLVKTAEQAGTRIMAAINGDYFWAFEEGKHPLGLHVSGGQLLRGPSGTTSLVVSPDGKVHMSAPKLEATALVEDVELPIHEFNKLAPRDGTSLYFGHFAEDVLPQYKCRAIVLETDGDSYVNRVVSAVVIRTLPKVKRLKLTASESALVVCGQELKGLPLPGAEVTLDLRLEGLTDPVAEAISGGPRILRQGETVFEGKAEGFAMWRRGYLSGTHPRTALGIGADGTTLYLIVAEGRPGGLNAIGAACVLKGLGAEEAMLLDGGGSSVMVWEDSIVNRPHAEKQRTHRRVANALAIILEESE